MKTKLTKMGNIRLIALISIVLAFPEFLYGQEKSSVELIINTGRIADEFDGIGAVSAGATSRLLIDYPEPYRSQILDFLFKPNYGAGLQHLKVEIGGDINSGEGSEPGHMRREGEENYNRGYEWWLMKEAKKRNPDIILDALVWRIPGWIGNGNDYSLYITKFLVGAKTHHNLDINYVGIWNERDFNFEWIKILRKTLDENGLTDVKIVAGDMGGPLHMRWKIADSVVADPLLAKAVFALGVHYPEGDVPESVLQLKKAGKKLWSSEDGEWNWVTWLPYRHLRAQKLNINYIDGHLTKTEFWSPVTSCYDCLFAPGSGMIKANTPWSGAYEIEKTLWAVAHTTQFAKPGWLYLENACFKLPGGGSVVSLTDPDRDNVSVIIETTGAGYAQEIVIKQDGEFNFEKLHVWHTSDLQDFIQEEDIYSVNGEFRFTVDSRSIYSLTTTNGQYKGRAGSPNPAPFPLPYNDNFDSYPEGAVPKYLSDQSGAFEIEQDKKGNKILVQQIYQEGKEKVITWASDKSVFSLIGDMNWTDIEVSADISFSRISEGISEKPFASVIARGFQGETGAGFMANNPVGYNFRLYADGTWKLLTASDELAGGQVDLKGKDWIKLKIKCQADRITAYIDNKKVCEITDSSYRRGLGGIGSNYEPVSFDNFYIYDTYSEK